MGHEGGEPQRPNLPLPPACSLLGARAWQPPLPRRLVVAPPGRERARRGCEGRCRLPWGYAAAKAAVRSPEVTNYLPPPTWRGNRGSGPSPSRAVSRPGGAAGRCRLAALGDCGLGPASQLLLQPGPWQWSELPSAPIGRSGMGSEAVYSVCSVFSLYSFGRCRRFFCGYFKKTKDKQTKKPRQQNLKTLSGCDLMLKTQLIVSSFSLLTSEVWWEGGVVVSYSKMLLVWQ